MKKILLTLLIIACFTAPMANVAGRAECDETIARNRCEDYCLDRTYQLEDEAALLASSNSEAFAKSALSSYLMDAASGKVVYSSNENARLTIASMTKIMLLNLAFEAVENGSLKLDEDYVVSERASSMGGSQVFLQANKPYKISDLIKSIIIASANDASVAVAERLYGSEQACTDEMNKKAGEWGLSNTLFSNCTGLPKPTQYSSAKDVAVMMQHLVKHNDYFTFSKIWLDKLVHPDGQETVLTNTNRLVNFYDGCDGGKTGFTNESKFCLSATAKRGNTRMICVVIGEPTSKGRFNEVREMLDYSFANYTSRVVLDKDKPLEEQVKISRGEQKYAQVVPSENFSLFLKRNEKCDLSYELVKPQRAVAPLNKGDELGEIIVYNGGVEIGRVKAVAYQSVKRQTIFGAIKEIAKNWKI